MPNPEIDVHTAVNVIASEMESAMESELAAAAEEKIDSQADAKGVAGAAAFSKFMTILQLIADADGPMNVAKLSAASGYPRTTVHRIIAALQAEGMVVPGLHGNTLKLGPRLISFASHSWERSDLRVAAMDALIELRNITSETVHLAVPSDLGMVFIEKLESPHAVRMASRIGTRVSMTSSSVGKAYLATLDSAACESILAQVKFQRYTDHTIMDLPTLRDDLVLTRQLGYAEDREENELAIFCYGAAIRGSHDRAMGCISISMPTFRHDMTDPGRYTKPLIEACRKIASQLGPALT